MTTTTASGPAPVFAAGTFAPAPRRNSAPAMLAALTRLEATLLLRNSEQQLLTMLLPVTFLIGLTVLPIGDLPEPRIDTVFPLVLAVAIMSTGFTGQAIAIGFDRRYGALKRLGANAIPKWAMIAGKSAAVVVVVSLQTVLLGTIALVLGCIPNPLEFILTGAVIIVGTAAFAALGLLLGGSMRADIVLALANILWFVQLGLCSVSSLTGHAPAAVQTAVEVTPAGALVTALQQANDGHFALPSLAVLTLWTAAATTVARRTFKFS
ncbi:MULTISPECIES: ABC transporter permease [unclassified Rhodococcus (in: high G+C Gram-positive bacteria)]|uniref:ABC transporter permease n=1 Tax=unclassified Rhodococcus (in: high G+C Gram-positive bacteria) TaxID=192944 RepID=UPI00163A923E|nr:MULTISPECIES: ABC transporter permease [unclassified Rhodococcus (in: high G+C Gram-positive bacteria)]MBC2641857.1 ABC transporter permease [Rhodococcus sp. 3A]MBC2893400.1 ABC transporter permease [Rhodococcus sp. 4CII]